MNEAITHFKVPVEPRTRAVCLGADGSVAHVARVLRMINGRWKLPILFRLFAEPSMRASQFMRDIPDISQKMLTQHLRELESDGLGGAGTISASGHLVSSTVLQTAGRGLMPVLMAVREFSRQHERIQPIVAPSE